MSGRLHDTASPLAGHVRKERDADPLSYFFQAHADWSIEIRFLLPSSVAFLSRFCGGGVTCPDVILCISYCGAPVLKNLPS